jgi:hypothetical protein
MNTKLSSGSAFVGGSDYSEVMEILNTLAHPCPTCSGKKIYFCLEESCESQSIFCYRCERSKHILHRVNELYLVFVDRLNVPSRNQQGINFLDGLINEFKTRK